MAFLSVIDRLILILFCGYFIWIKTNHSFITIDFFILSQTFAYLLTISIGLFSLIKFSKNSQNSMGQIIFYNNN